MCLGRSYYKTNIKWKNRSRPIRRSQRKIMVLKVGRKFTWCIVNTKYRRRWMRISYAHHEVKSHMGVTSSTFFEPECPDNVSYSSKRFHSVGCVYFNHWIARISSSLIYSVIIYVFILIYNLIFVLEKHSYAAFIRT